MCSSVPRAGTALGLTYIFPILTTTKRGSNFARAHRNLGPSSEVTCPTSHLLAGGRARLGNRPSPSPTMITRSCGCTFPKMEAATPAGTPRGASPPPGTPIRPSPPRACLAAEPWEPLPGALPPARLAQPVQISAASLGNYRLPAATGAGRAESQRPSDSQPPKESGTRRWGQAPPPRGFTTPGRGKRRARRRRGAMTSRAGRRPSPPPLSRGLAGESRRAASALPGSWGRGVLFFLLPPLSSPLPPFPLFFISFPFHPFPLPSFLPSSPPLFFLRFLPSLHPSPSTASFLLTFLPSFLPLLYPFFTLKNNFLRSVFNCGKNK